MATKGEVPVDYACTTKVGKVSIFYVISSEPSNDLVIFCILGQCVQ